MFRHMSVATIVAGAVTLAVGVYTGHAFHTVGAVVTIAGLIFLLQSSLIRRMCTLERQQARTAALVEAEYVIRHTVPEPSPHVAPPGPEPRPRRGRHADRRQRGHLTVIDGGALAAIPVAMAGWVVARLREQSAVTVTAGAALVAAPFALPTIADMAEPTSPPVVTRPAPAPPVETVSPSEASPVSHVVMVEPTPTGTVEPTPEPTDFAPTPTVTPQPLEPTQAEPTQPGRAEPTTPTAPDAPPEPPDVPSGPATPTGPPRTVPADPPSEPGRDRTGRPTEPAHTPSKSSSLDRGVSRAIDRPQPPDRARSDDHAERLPRWLRRSGGDD